MPYSGLVAFCLGQRLTDSAWGRLRGLWRFLLPAPHETVPVREGFSHGRYLVSRFLRRLGPTGRGGEGETPPRSGSKRHERIDGYPPDPSEGGEPQRSRDRERSG